MLENGFRLICFGIVSVSNLEFRSLRFCMILEDTKIHEDGRILILEMIQRLENIIEAASMNFNKWIGKADLFYHCLYQLSQS